MGTTDVNKVGTTVEAGLPNITGGTGALGGSEVKYGSFTGAFFSETVVKYYARTTDTSGTSRHDGWKFDASRSSPIYGNSDTVQPAALYVFKWKRTA